MESRAVHAPRVFLVGAGPGDPGLITVRGLTLLSRAEVVIYDYLAAPALLRQAPAGAELLYVGKQADRHTLPQTEINALLIAKARAGKVVVRLKGGDPYVFGRGGEEALALAEAGIAFEVVPGVTAAIAAAAYAGIPVTHRELASELALITGHEDAERAGESRVDWEVLARWRGTLAFYMGVKNLPEIAGRLMEHGMAPATPAALVRWGTTPRQETLAGTLADIAQLAQERHFAPPALILVGQVIRLRAQLNWFERRPLFGQTIVITRSREQASLLAEQLAERGAQVLEFPTIRVEPPAAWAPLQQAAAEIGQYQWAIFTSVNGVEFFFQALAQAGRDARALGPCRVCAIGPATGQRLREFGIRADLVPGEFVAEAVLAALQNIGALAGQRMLLPRADLARPDLAEGLRAAGAELTEVVAYRTVPAQAAPAELRAALAEDRVDWLTFTSSSTVQNFLAATPAAELRGKRCRIASIGPITSATLRAAGLAVHVQAAEYTIPGLVAALVSAGPK